MKCVDCLPLLEEFFDGEVDDKTGGRVREHLAACAECAEAFDALRAEQEMFLRYDRGLEVSPALWQGVRAAVARAECAEPQTRTRPFLSTLRGQLAAALGLFAVRPALASSMALLAVGVTAGALWLADSQRQPAATPARIADNGGGVRPAPTTNDTPATTSIPDGTPDEVARHDAPAGTAPVNDVTGRRGAGDVIRRAAAPAEAAAPRGGTSASRETTGGVVNFAETGHEVAADDALPTVAHASLVEANFADAAAVLDPEDEAVARHVQRAQMLLRSIKNTSAADGGDDLAYERELSRKLLEENFSLQLDADADNNKKAQKVLKDLEPYLNDIANLRERPARGELRSLKERMQKQEIIAALHVYDD